MTDHENLQEQADREQKAREDLLSAEDKRRLLGRAMRELRARLGVSQEALGLESDIHRNYIGAMERGEINPSFRVFLKLSRGLGMPLSTMMRIYERNLAQAQAEAEQARTAFEARIDRIARAEGDVLANLHDDQPTPARRLAWAGQQHAAAYLERLGLRIVERDVPTRWGAIDLIAQDDERLVICEVTTRRFGASPPKTLSDTRRRNIRRAATALLEQRRAAPCEVRFDQVAVTIDSADELVGLEHRVLTTERAAEAAANSDPDRYDQ